MTEPRAPSPGYIISLAFGAVGWFPAGVAAATLLDNKSTLSQSNAFDTGGAVGFILAFGILFGFRVIFWRKAPPNVRSIVGVILTCLMLALVVLVASMAVYMIGHHNGSPIGIGMTIIAGILQVATLVWLVRFRPEQSRYA